MRFRWVRKRVKIVSRDESWPEKERQAKGQKMHSKISLFSNFLFGFTVFFFFFPPKQSFLPPPSWHFWWADEKTRIHGIAGWGNFTDELIKPVMKIGPRRGHCTHRASQTNGCDADLSPQQQYGHKARLEGRLQRLRRKSNWACSQLSLTSNGSLSSGNLQDGDIPVFPRQLVPLCLTLTTISFGVIQPALTQFLLISRCSCNILASWLKDPIHLSLQS